MICLTVDTIHPAACIVSFSTSRCAVLVRRVGMHLGGSQTPDSASSINLINLFQIKDWACNIFWFRVVFAPISERVFANTSENAFVWGGAPNMYWHFLMWHVASVILLSPPVCYRNFAVNNGKEPTQRELLLTRDIAQKEALVKGIHTFIYNINIFYGSHREKVVYIYI